MRERMTERERLIELLRKSEILCNDCGEYGNTYCTEAIADHLLSNSVIVPPCKVGDSVWGVVGEQVVTYWVCAIETDKFNSAVVVSHIIGGAVLHRIRAFVFSDFGKTVFLTKEDAEKALKERQSHD